ncbi:hypothetical protein Ddye_028216 [Dipteronia dyeriana]|uniref:Protein ALP1-like n=1 Tax=Dipteronia dyeriana TaxID=168575 RepID=A0AAD9TQS6_9ROSI|nr:hypothetical protein Ddye_028216 [Dipteronia dyeriana]
MKHEATHKDVERAFGVLQSRWVITRNPVRYSQKDDLCKTMNTCIILHNMIIKDERHTNLEPWNGQVLNDRVGNGQYLYGRVLTDRVGYGRYLYGRV